MTNNTAYTNYMQRAFVTAYEFLDHTERDSSMNPKGNRAEIWTDGRFCPVYQFIKDVASETNSKYVEEMIKNFFKKPVNVNLLRTGISVEKTLGDNTKGYASKEPGVFVRVEDENKRAYFEMTTPERNVHKIEPRLITFAMYRAVQSSEKIADIQTRQKFQSYLSSATSFFLFYFTKSILRYLEICSYHDSDVKRDITLLHSFAEHGEIARPTFGMSMKDQMVNKFKEHRKFINETSSLFGYPIDQNIIEEAVTKFGEVFEEGTTAMRSGGDFKKALSKLTGVARSFNDAISEGKNYEPGDINRMPM